MTKKGEIKWYNTTLLAAELWNRCFSVRLVHILPKTFAVQIGIVSFYKIVIVKYCFPLLFKFRVKMF